MEMQFCWSARALEQHFESRISRPVSLIFTDNGTSMLSVKELDGVTRVRLHRMFAHADREVIDEIASFLKSKKGGMPLFRSFLKENRSKLGTRQPNKVTIKTTGKFHELTELYDRINKEYFSGTVSAAITWGSRSPRSAARKRTLGSYSMRSNIIRINPLLDRKPVPSYYVAFVVYHEMLHAFLGITEKAGRRRVHTKEFKTREKLFADYEKAVAWEQGKTAV